ncbi:hypothetical protein HK103_003977 [Boothiomyces macroporosus]|uniref:Wax synthase domain-containing protein n=1 Tax=Boothiomyces macroporosus TaxID=261099 RepID=A0AAD5UL19_9FUNG|nr:hypothetical protein HK103_003977 [Boothiomyces macroporosus]
METPKRFNLPTDPRTIKPQDLQLSYVLKYTGTGLLKYFLYSLILSYVRETRFHWNPTKLQLYQFDDPWVAIDLYLLGLALSLLLDYADHLLILPLCYIFKMEYTPIMNAVYLSCSVREFWGSRWNSMIQRGLKCSIFDPVLEALKGFPIPFKFKVTIATLLTFVFSAIMHEWCILIVCDEPTTYEQLAFFTVQAFICTFEVLVSIMFKRIFGLKIGHVFPKVVQVLWATIAVLSTSPLFLNPFIRGKVFDKFHLDYDIMKAYVERNFLK